jgi:hypothetical protein
MLRILSLIAVAAMLVGCETKRNPLLPPVEYSQAQ